MLQLFSRKSGASAHQAGDGGVHQLHESSKDLVTEEGDDGEHDSGKDDNKDDSPDESGDSPVALAGLMGEAGDQNVIGMTQN